MTGITRRLAEFVVDVDYASLDPRVVERTRMLLMDQVGICIRGRNDAGLSAPMSAALRHLGLGSGNASVIGDDAAYSPPAAALFNGNLGHSLDFDDTHASGSIHPSAPIVPAALAAAEMVGANGRTVVAAVVAGYEVQIRLSLALGPSDHYRQGFHPTPTCGVFGAATAAGRVLGLDASQMEDAFGLCGSLAAGSMQFLVDGAWNKPFHTGYAAMNGLGGGLHGAGGIPRCARGPSKAAPASFMRTHRMRIRTSPTRTWVSDGRRCGSRSSRIRPAGTATRRWTRCSRFARSTASTGATWSRWRSESRAPAGTSSETRKRRSSGPRPTSTDSSPCPSARRWRCATGPSRGTPTPPTSATRKPSTCAGAFAPSSTIGPRRTSPPGWPAAPG